MREWCVWLILGVFLLWLPPQRGSSLSVDKSVNSTVHQHHSLIRSDWKEHLASDPTTSLEITLQQYKQHVQSFSGIMIKQERIGKVLHPVEKMKFALREEPFAVCMIWQEGQRNQAIGTLYVAGENAGSMKVWRPEALFAKILSVSPLDALPRTASRYTITESSIYHGQLRTVQRWKEQKKHGTLNVEYLGQRFIPELGKECHVLKRKCEPEVDSFAIDELPTKTASQNPSQAFSTVMVYLDSETGYQIGAELLHKNGERIGAYFFKDIVYNPKFPAGQFTEQAFVK